MKKKYYGLFRWTTSEIGSCEYVIYEKKGSTVVRDNSPWNDKGTMVLNIRGHLIENLMGEGELWA